MQNNGIVNNKDVKHRTGTVQVTWKDGLKMFYTNADQFVNKRDDLLMLIADDRPDIILITEVIPKKQTNPITQALLDIDDYKCSLNFEPDDANLGASGIRGVAIYSKETLGAIDVDISTNGFHDHVWIEIPSENHDSVLIGCVYRSPSNDSDSNGCMRSTKEITQLINNAYKRNNNLMIAGDFNYKEVDWIYECVPPEKTTSHTFYRDIARMFFISACNQTYSVS